MSPGSSRSPGWGACSCSFGGFRCCGWLRRLGGEPALVRSAGSGVVVGCAAWVGSLLLFVRRVPVLWLVARPGWGACSCSFCGFRCCGWLRRLGGEPALVCSVGSGVVVGCAAWVGSLLLFVRRVPVLWLVAPPGWGACSCSFGGFRCC